MSKPRKLVSVDGMSQDILSNWKKNYLASSASEAIRAVERELRGIDRNEKKFKFKI